jgi:hypothetical protein
VPSGIIVICVITVGSAVQIKRSRLSNVYSNYLSRIPGHAESWCQNNVQHVTICSASSPYLPEAETHLVFLNCGNYNIKSPVLFVLSKNVFIFQSIDVYDMNKRKGGIDFYLTKPQKIK